MDLTERTIDSREVFRGRIIRVRQDTVRLPNGKESSREVVEHPGGVGILAIDGEDRVVLVRQYRYAFERVLTEEEGEEVPADEEEEFEVQYARLRKVVDGLPEKCREIFILGCVDGLSYKEVSEKMGVSVNTVKTQIKLAYRKLKLELGGQNFVWEWTAGGVLFILMQK